MSYPDQGPYGTGGYADGGAAAAAAAGPGAGAGPGAAGGAGAGGVHPDMNEIAMQKDAALRQILDPAARLRLNNVRMVRPELAAALENHLITLAAQGRIASQVTDEQLKQMLMSLRRPKHDFKFSRR